MLEYVESIFDGQLVKTIPITTMEDFSQEGIAVSEDKGVLFLNTKAELHVVDIDSCELIKDLTSLFDQHVDQSVGVFQAFGSGNYLILISSQKVVIIDWVKELYVTTIEKGVGTVSQKTYVGRSSVCLVEGGTINRYSFDGALLESIPVDRTIDGIFHALDTFYVINGDGLYAYLPESGWVRNFYGDEVTRVFRLSVRGSTVVIYTYDNRVSIVDFLSGQVVLEKKDLVSRGSSGSFGTHGLYVVTSERLVYVYS